MWTVYVDNSWLCIVKICEKAPEMSCRADLTTIVEYSWNVEEHDGGGAYLQNSDARERERSSNEQKHTWYQNEITYL